MTIIGSAYVEIRALDTNLRRDIDNAMKQVKDVTLNLKADVNLAPVRAKIDELRAELRNNPLKFHTEVDDSHIIESLADSHKLYEDNPLRIVSHADTTPMETALQTIRERFREMPTHVTTNADTLRADAQLAAVARNRTTHINANADTARAEAQLDLLARRRTVTIAPKIQIDPEIQKALSGLMYTMMGAVPGPAIKSSIAGVLGNIEQLSISMAKMTTIAGSAGAGLLTLGANAFSLAGDLVSVVGLFAAMPAAFSGMIVGITASHIAWNNFGNAMSSNAKTAAKAMALLPTEAQKAAKELKGLWEQVTKPAQKAFWVEMGTSLQDTVKNILPVAKDGFVQVEVSLAKMVKGALTSFNNLKNSGGMATLFDNIAKGMDGASRAVTPFFDALNRLSVTGSKYLPIFGEWLLKSADRFNAFITKSDEAGKISVWINTAVANLKDLGSILGSTGDIFKGFVAVSDMSGGKGLHDMAEGMKDIAKTVNSEPFTSRMVVILEGARAGMDALGKGIGAIVAVAGKSSVALSEFLKIAGETGGQLLTNLSKVFDGTGFGGGFMDFLFGIKKAMTDLEPTFSNIGGIMGDFFQIASVVLVNMVPGLNSLFDTLRSIIGELREGVLKTIPIFNDFVQKILVVAAPIAIALASALGKVLSFFADLPAFLQNAILGLGLFFFALSKIKKLLADTDKGEMSDFNKKVHAVRDTMRDTFGTGSPIHTGLSLIGSAATNAKDVIGKAFRNIADDAKVAGMYIAEGFKKSFSQLGGEISKLAVPAKNFASMMGAIMKEALLPEEVRNGFKVVGEKLGDVAKMYTSYFSTAKAAITDFGKAIATAFPASMLGPALKALPGEIGQTMIWAGQKMADGVTALGKILAGPQVEFAMGKMKEIIQAQALYASKHLENIGNGMKTAVETIQKAPAMVKGALTTLAASASEAFNNIKLSAATAFNSAVLAAAINPMTAPFVQMADSAKTAAGTAVGHLKGMAVAVGSAVNEATVPARVAFASIATAASIEANVMADKFKIAAGAIGGRFSEAFGGARADLANVGANLSDTMGRAFAGISNAASTAAGAVTSSLGTAGTKLKENFAPAGAAIKEAFSGISGHLAPAGTALREIGTAAGVAASAIGTQAKAGLKGAAGGLLDALGGPWGIALGVATAALTMYADSLAESKQKTEALANTLDKASGQVTGATKAMLATNALDGATNDWDNFYRGVVDRSKSVEESLGKLGTSTKDYTEKLADSSGRDSYVKGLQDISLAMNLGRPITEEMAAAIGTTKEALKGVNGNDMMHLAEKAKNAAEELKRAEEKVKGIADATGTSSVMAKILSKNFETLASTTSTASDKFTALKQNLDLLNQSADAKNNKFTNVSAEKAYQQTLDDTKKSIQGVIEKNGGLVGNLYTVGKGFDLTSQAGRDLHTALDGQSDAILKIGTTAMDQALKAGKSTAEAQGIAISAMAPGVEGLKKTMADIGLSEPQIQAIIKSFGLMPDQISTAIDVKGADEAQRKIIMTKAVADAFSKGNYSAMLSALPDGAKQAIIDVTGKGKEFAEGDYEAVLKSFDGTAGGREAALAAILGTTNGNYLAAIKAWDATGAGRQAAERAIFGTANADYIAWIKARGDQGTLNATNEQLNALATTRYATIVAQWKEVGRNPGLAAAQDGLANGGVYTGQGSRAFADGGFQGVVTKAFANGGTENHVAQIARGAWPVRTWAEPETGGEAYIPLGNGKRPRSLKILEQVAEMFGFSLVKKLNFANGGIMASIQKSMPTQTVVRPSLNTAQPHTTAVVTNNSQAPTLITNVYPSAGLSEQQVADSVSENLYWKLTTQI